MAPTSRLGSRVVADIADFEGKWRNLNEPLIALELAYAWLKSHLDFAEGKRTIIHRDVGCHNMLVQDGHLSALLEWETAAIGNPAQDLAYAYHTVIQVIHGRTFLPSMRNPAAPFQRNMRSISIAYGAVSGWSDSNCWHAPIFCRE